MQEKRVFDLGLRYVREECGISQRTLSQKLNMAQPSINQIEGMTNDVRISSLKRYIEALGGKLKIEITFNDDKNQTYILYEGEKMSNHGEDFFNKIALKKAEEENEKKIVDESILKKKKTDENELLVFISETQKLITTIEEDVKGKVDTRKLNLIVKSEYYQSKVDGIELSFGEVCLQFIPTGPMYGRAMGIGVIEIMSNSPLLNKNPWLQRSLILKKENGGGYIWAYNEYDKSSTHRTHIKYDKDLFYALLKKCFLE